MATHSSILAWRIPPEEPGGLQSAGIYLVLTAGSALLQVLGMTHSIWRFKQTNVNRHTGLSSSSRPVSSLKDLSGTEGDSALCSLGLSLPAFLLGLHPALVAACFPSPYRHAPVSPSMPNCSAVIYLSVFTARLPEKLIYSLFLISGSHPFLKPHRY